MAEAFAERGRPTFLLYAHRGPLVAADDVVHALDALNDVHNKLTVRLMDLASGKMSFIGRDENDLPILQPTGLAFKNQDQESVKRIHHSADRYWYFLRPKVRRLIMPLKPGIKAMIRVVRAIVPTIYMTLRAPPIIRQYSSNLTIFRNFLEQGSYQGILIPEDVVGDVWPVLVKAANQLGIRTLVFPYTLANQEEAFKTLFRHPAYQSRVNRIAAITFPRWRKRANGADVVRLPAAHILAHYRHGIAPPDPWMMNSGYATLVCVDSLSSRDYFLQSGIPADKLCVVGSISQDSLYEKMQHKEEGAKMLRKELGLSDAKPILLISGCPNQLAGPVPYCEFETIEELADHVGRAVSELKELYHLVVRPHPNFPLYGELLKTWGVTVTMIPTANLIPLCDLFIAFASATIRWAIACSVPSINYDVFHYDYSEYEMVEGVQTVSAREDFIQAVNRMASHQHYREMKTRINAHAHYWGLLDGRCAERIDEVIEATCNA